MAVSMAQAALPHLPGAVERDEVRKRVADDFEGEVRRADKQARLNCMRPAEPQVRITGDPMPAGVTPATPRIHGAFD